MKREAVTDRTGREREKGRERKQKQGTWALAVGRPEKTGWGVRKVRRGGVRSSGGDGAEAASCAGKRGRPAGTAYRLQRQHPGWW